MARQQAMNLNGGNWGGLRTDAGRKRIKSKGVAHRTRESVSVRTPLHVNFKYRTTIKNKACLKLLKRAILNSRRKGLKILHFSLQHNHIHLIVEAINNQVLSSGMRSLLVTFAMGLNQGPVQLERYHLHVLRSRRETKNAVHYVLFNRQRHEKGTSSTIDEYTSLVLMTNALELVRKFAVSNRMTLVLRKGDGFKLDRGRSYLLS